MHAKQTIERLRDVKPWEEQPTLRISFYDAKNKTGGLYARLSQDSLNKVLDIIEAEHKEKLNDLPHMRMDVS